MDGKVAAEDQLKKLLADPELMAALQGTARCSHRGQAGRTRRTKTTHRRPSQGKLTRAEARHGYRTYTGQSRDRRRRDPEADEFSALLKQSFKPRTERAATEVENAVTTLVAAGARRHQR